MRAFCNSLMAALVVVALFWGNCFSCPQMLLQAMQKQAHSCCHKKTQTPAPAKVDCQSQGLQTFLKADQGAPQLALLPHRAPVVLPEPAVRLEAAPPAVREAVPLAPLTIIRV